MSTPSFRFYLSWFLLYDFLLYDYLVHDLPILCYTRFSTQWLFPSRLLFLIFDLFGIIFFISRFFVVTTTSTISRNLNFRKIISLNLEFVKFGPASVVIVLCLVSILYLVSSENLTKLANKRHQQNALLLASFINFSNSICS